MSYSTLTGIALILLGGSCSVWGFKILHVRSKKNHWPSVVGKITKKTVQEANTPSMDPGIPYTIEIEYRYSVGTNQYTGNNFYSGYPMSMHSYMREKAQKIVNSLPESLAIHYNPQDPSDSFVFHEPRLWIYSMMAISISSFLIGILTILS